MKSSPAQALGSWVIIPLEAWMSAFILCLSSPLQVAALRRADPPSKESYRLSTRFTIIELILNGNRPDSLIRQGKFLIPGRSGIVSPPRSNCSCKIDGYQCSFFRRGYQSTLRKIGELSLLSMRLHVMAGMHKACFIVALKTSRRSFCLIKIL
jgi:hypothetical protein